VWSARPWWRFIILKKALHKPYDAGQVGIAVFLPWERASIPRDDAVDVRFRACPVNFDGPAARMPRGSILGDGPFGDRYRLLGDHRLVRLLFRRRL
jgi:hypothetical protein